MTRQEFEDECYENVSNIIHYAYEYDFWSLTDRFYSDDNIADAISQNISGRSYNDWHDVIMAYADIEESPYDTYYSDDYGELTPIRADDAEWMYDELREFMEDNNLFDDDDEDPEGEDEFDEPESSEFIRSEDDEDELVTLKKAVRSAEFLFAI